MYLSSFLLALFRFFVIPALLTTPMLYLYPIFQGCEFPVPQKLPTACVLEGNLPERDIPAPFRLLVFGDPQLEGDTSLPDSNAPIFPSLERLRYLSDPYVQDSARAIWTDVVTKDIPDVFAAYRKRLDLLGNDFYLAHIYRTLHWWVEPTHVSVLGDLLGSQWISDGEFDARGDRFWNRVFAHGQRVDDELALSSRRQELGVDPAWSTRIINVAGNHDIGYAGDLDQPRLERFERVFGRANYDLRFTLPASQTQARDSSAADFSDLGGPPELRIIVLNSMNLDGPALDSDLQTSTYDFVNSVISHSRPVEDRKSATLLLTHIPLHKESGMCADAPFMRHDSSGLREQNHLSPTSSRTILEGLLGKHSDRNAPHAGLGRNGLIMTGHDHEGCDVWHHIGRANGSEWTATPYARSRLVRAEDEPGVREITQRSMMGSFGGYAGMLSAWWDGEEGEWRFAYDTCTIGVQHIWWGVHVLVLVVLMLGLGGVLAWVWEEWAARKALEVKEKSEIVAEKVDGGASASGMEVDVGAVTRRVPSTKAPDI